MLLSVKSNSRLVEMIFFVGAGGERGRVGELGVYQKNCCPNWRADCEDRSTEIV